MLLEIMIVILIIISFLFNHLLFVQNLKIYSLPDFIDHIKQCDINGTIFQCYRKSERIAFNCQHSKYMDIKQRKCRFRKELQQSMQTWWNAKEQWQQKLSVCLSEKEFVETKKKMEQPYVTTYNIEFQDCLQETKEGIKICHQLSLICDKFKLCWEKAEVIHLGQQADEAYRQKSQLLESCLNQNKR